MCKYYSLSMYADVLCLYIELCEDFWILINIL